MTLLPDMVPKVLRCVEESFNKRMHLPHLDWLVFLHSVWVKMFVKNTSMPPPPLTICKHSKVEVPTHSNDMLIPIKSGEDKSTYKSISIVAPIRSE